MAKCKPTIRDSYSTSLLVAMKSKWTAELKTCLVRLIRITPAPTQVAVNDPSMYMEGQCPDWEVEGRLDQP